MKKKFLYLLFIFLLLISCFLIYIYFNDSYRFYFSYTLYNYFPYENGKYIKVGIPMDNKVQYLDEDEEVISFLESGTGVLYFGYPECPWCRNIVGPLISATKNKNINLYYADAHKLKDKDKLFGILGEYLKEDEGGAKRLYVPDVYFVSDGEILSHHIGSIESYKNPFLGMNDEQKQEMISIYTKQIDKIMEEYYAR